jgi:hypothetical protein
MTSKFSQQTQLKKQRYSVPGTYRPKIAFRVSAASSVEASTGKRFRDYAAERVFQEEEEEGEKEKRNKEKQDQELVFSEDMNEEEEE